MVARAAGRLKVWRYELLRGLWDFGDWDCVVCCWYPQRMAILNREEIVRLSPSERLALIGQLWESLEHDEIPLTQAQHVELDRRLASFQQDRARGITWAALKAELEQRYP